MKSKKANRLGEAELIEHCFLKRLKSVPERMGISTTPAWTGTEPLPVRMLILKGRPQNYVYEIPLTINGWKQLRRVCRQAIKMINHDEKEKEKTIKG